MLIYQYMIIDFASISIFLLVHDGSLYIYNRMVHLMRHVMGHTQGQKLTLPAWKVAHKNFICWCNFIQNMHGGGSNCSKQMEGSRVDLHCVGSCVKTDSWLYKQIGVRTCGVTQKLAACESKCHTIMKSANLSARNSPIPYIWLTCVLL